MVSCPCPPISDPRESVSEDLPKAPSPAGSLNPVKGPRKDEGPMEPPGVLHNSISGHSLAVASAAAHWGESEVPSGTLMNPCDESLIDYGSAAAEPGSNGQSCAELALTDGWCWINVAGAGTFCWRWDLLLNAPVLSICMNMCKLSIIEAAGSEQFAGRNCRMGYWHHSEAFLWMLLHMNAFAMML
ncbi:hypothetical protein Nepgr_002709 [Nepenthes gracilis]|uniref:Uncharacterized protein n=1 Tax=Nepenthes gracilis TaxID=150966 RepID=A0AAD3P471_NEPGR|nr:hypothetical protein Nepgr_002709 [Nepenthes gracilis]